MWYFQTILCGEYFFHITCDFLTFYMIFHELCNQVRIEVKVRGFHIDFQSASSTGK